MPKGNPNPSPETRFGAENGNPTNLGGKTKEQRESEYKSAEMSARIREVALSLMLENVEAGNFTIEDLITPANLKLFKDSEDRAHGTPKQSLDVESPDGSMTPVFRTIYESKPDKDAE